MSKQRLSYRAPKTLMNNARRGVTLKDKWSRGGQGVFAVSAKGASAGLAIGETLHWDDIKKMNAYFEGRPNSFNPNRTEKDGGPDEDTINWLLHGGTAGKQWAKRIIESNEEEPVNKFNCNNQILKVDESLGLVMGFAIISKKDGEDYYDLQGDHIPEDAMLKAAADFMMGARVVGDMHEKAEGGTVVFAWPMTTEIAKAFGIEIDTTGLMIAIKPENEETLQKFRDGTYTGFSIGGVRITDEEVETA